MTNNKWAVIVYSRTYEVDFRLITIPHDFNDERIDWVQKYINSTTRYPQKLPQNPCWSLFKDHKHCVVGVTCMVKDLLGDSSEENPEDITKDVYGRDLFVFVCYVAQMPHPPIPAMNLELFKDLYSNYVRPRWNEKSYEVRKIEEERKHFSTYDKIFDLDDCIWDDCIKWPENLETYIFNENLNKRLVWSISANQNLWYVASQQDQPLSICLGLSSKKYFLEGEFLNGTASDVIGDNRYSYPEILEKPKEIAPKEIKQSEKPEDDRDHQVTSDDSRKANHRKNQDTEDNYTSHNQQKQRKNKDHGKKAERKSQESRNFSADAPELDDQQFTYLKTGIKNLRQSIQEGNKRQKNTFNEARKQVEDSIQALQDNISKYFNSDFFAEELHTKFNQILREFEEVKQLGTELFGSGDKYDSSSQKKADQQEEPQSKIEIDYGFKKKSDEDKSQPKEWF